MNGRRSHLKLVSGLLAVGTVAILIGVWTLGTGWRPTGTNFHAVIPETIFRSAQLSGADLERVVRQHSIAGIVNLRGSQPGATWYDAEVAVAQRLDVRHHDVRMSADRLPPRPLVASLIDLLETGSSPLLIHCDAGADRAGFASAVARLVLTDAGVPEAREELGIGFGHVPFGPSAELDRFFDAYEQYLREARQPHRPSTFKHWATRVYAPYAYDAAIEAIRFPARAVAYVAFEVRFRVVNLSSETWTPWDPASGRGVRLGFFLRPAGTAEWHAYRHRLDFERPVEPGQTAETAGLFYTPAVPGDYDVKVDLVDETVTWFESQGSAALTLPLAVEAKR